MSPQTPEEQLAFIMTCLKHCSEKPKPDFDEVAKELNLAANTCYHRHWRLMKDWGVGGSKAAGAGSALARNAPSTPSSNGKRGRPKGSASKKGAIELAGETNNDEIDDDTPIKKPKTEASDTKRTVSAAIEIDSDKEV